MAEFVPSDLKGCTGTVRPPHSPDDKGYVDELSADMKVNGWKGAPVVRIGCQAITGSHRIAAAKKAGIPVPAKTLDDVFKEEGKSLKAAWEEESKGLSDPRWQTVLPYVQTHLSKKTRQKYGLDFGT